MKKYTSKWKDRDLEETNKLYEIVKYYGGYLWYYQNVNEGAFEAFYNHREKKMGSKFINTANADARQYFHKKSISGTKMRRLLITGKGKRVTTYEWLPEYVEYFISKCLENELLEKRVYSILQIDCTYCADRLELEERKILCTKRLLGFQYVVLNKTSAEIKKGTEWMRKNTKEIENSDVIDKLVDSCKK